MPYRERSRRFWFFFYAFLGLEFESCTRDGLEANTSEVKESKDGQSNNLSAPN